MAWKEKQKKFQFSKLFSSSIDAVDVSSSSSPSYIRHCIALGLTATFTQVRPSNILRIHIKIASIVLIFFLQLMDPARLESLQVMKQEIHTFNISRRFFLRLINLFLSLTHPNSSSLLSQTFLFKRHLSNVLYIFYYFSMACTISDLIYTFSCQHISIYLQENVAAVYTIGKKGREQFSTLYSAAFQNIFHHVEFPGRRQNNFFLPSRHIVDHLLFKTYLRRYVFSI